MSNKIQMFEFYEVMERPEIKQAMEMAEELSLHCKRFNIHNAVMHNVAIDASAFAAEIRRKVKEEMQHASDTEAEGMVSK